jgi:hypothetical protein
MLAALTRINTGQAAQMKKDSSFLDSVQLFLDKNGKPVAPWVNLTPTELCQAEKISPDALAELHDSPDPDAAPPRYRVSPRRWGYPIGLYLQWKQRKLSAANLPKHKPEAA